MRETNAIGLNDLKKFRVLFAYYGPMLAIIEGLGNKETVNKRLVSIGEVLAQVDEDIKLYPMSVQNGVGRNYKQMLQDIQDSREVIEAMLNLIS